MVWAVSPRRWLLAHRLQHCRATFLRPAAADTRFPCVDAYATFRRRPVLESWRKASQRMRLGCPSTQVFSTSPCDVRGPRYSQFPTFSPAVPPSHRPGSLELGDLEYGDFWSQALPPSPESMLAAKKFLIDRAVLTMHEIFHKSKPHRPGSLDYERNFGIKKISSTGQSRPARPRTRRFLVSGISPQLGMHVGCKKISHRPGSHNYARNFGTARRSRRRRRRGFLAQNVFGRARPGCVASLAPLR